MNSELKSGTDGQTELVVTLVASVQLAEAAAAPVEEVEELAAAPSLAPAPLPTSIRSVIEGAIRNEDDDVEAALIEALRSTKP